MKILFMRWKSFGIQDFTEELELRGYQVVFYEFPKNTENTRLNTELAERLIRKIMEVAPVFVFSYNYFPVIALACKACNIKYVSWTYDSPFVQLYSNTIHFDTNYVFVFDQHVYRELRQKGITTVYYLPMSAPVSRYDSYLPSKEGHNTYNTEISFVGSTYSEKENQFFERLKGLPPYASGYLDGIVEAQKKIYGSFILEKLLLPEVIEEMQKICPVGISQDGFETPEWVYAHYFLARKVTALERQEVLQMLSNHYQVRLYTNEDTPNLPKVDNQGNAEFYQEAPIIYKCSKINLNITLKSIVTGMPLRVMDIMGCRGFLISNYQEDFLEFFEPDVDFVYYQDYEDLQRKVEYYLTHDREREEIAQNGYDKVKESHTYKNRVTTILNRVGLPVML